jgi:hypothetical protein
LDLGDVGMPGIRNVFNMQYGMGCLDFGKIILKERIFMRNIGPPYTIRLLQNRRIIELWEKRLITD